MTIRTKLLGGSVILSLMVAILLVSSTWTFNSLENGFEDIIEKSTIGAQNSKHTQKQLSSATQSLLKSSNSIKNINNEISKTNLSMKVVERKIKQISGNLKEFTQLADDVTESIPEGDLLYDLQDLFDELGDIEEIMRREALISLTKTVNKMIEMTTQIDNQASQINVLSTEIQKIEKLSKEVVDANQQINNVTDSFNTKISVSKKLIISLLFVIVIFLAFSFLLGYTISKRLNMAVNALDDIAEGEGNLTQRLDESGSDEISSLSKAFNLFAQKIQDIIVEVMDASQIINQSVDEVTQVNDKTNINVAKQEKESAKVVDSMNSITMSIKGVADSASSASDAAKHAESEVIKGNEIVNESRNYIHSLADEMATAEDIINQLQDKSNDIGSILDTIRGIAEQTNLLALNAAIEAARAGEQGRGFAVVADEVRMLAHKTQESTNEIQSMIAALQEMSQKSVISINNGREGVDVSVEKSDKVSDSLQLISDTIGTMTHLNEGVAHSTEEQLKSTIDMENNITSISKITQTTVEGVNQTQKSLSNLAEQTVRLQELVSQFKTA